MKFIYKLISYHNMKIKAVKNPLIFILRYYNMEWFEKLISQHRSQFMRTEHVKETLRVCMLCNENKGRCIFICLIISFY